MAATAAAAVGGRAPRHPWTLHLLRPRSLARQAAAVHRQRTLMRGHRRFRPHGPMIHCCTRRLPLQPAFSRQPQPQQKPSQAPPSTSNVKQLQPPPRAWPAPPRPHASRRQCRPPRLLLLLCLRVLLPRFGFRHLRVQHLRLVSRHLPQRWRPQQQVLLPQSSRWPLLLLRRHTRPQAMSPQLQTCTCRCQCGPSLSTVQAPTSSLAALAPGPSLRRPPSPRLRAVPSPWTPMLTLTAACSTCRLT